MLTEYLPTIQNLKPNVFCGGLGAVLVIVYQLFKVLPDIKAELFDRKEGPKRRFLIPLLVIAIKSILSIFGAALVTGFLIRPAESYGAFLSGMTWTALVQQFLKEKELENG